ncbi:hypothetical protein VOLCADRAFT_98576 [Volvox carteri f. nagariensis]|uniref:Uncharacterized protein n=1 Tax=Volvox carteri f. nagariensis TaxID=3068 RepID=D8UFQ3_VOLCA|nr:uncharacterized protein VOLCADRAFT_98576 [Volvox carteri f. nagariensis]EFJ41379.1 hypothetical protein VOLCADRAFT_98576 [Volvox carteri f. nagariensis]|eukprot:XP_002957485.1 hypothetical protein VOLCADRAFT_98576 [Volvox carteri f. nagariensis]
MPSASTSTHSESSPGPPTDIYILWVQMKSASPTGGAREKAIPSGIGSSSSKPLTYKQKLLLSSFCLHDEAARFVNYTNVQLNTELERGRQHHVTFEATYGSKPATTVLYTIKRIHDGEMPEFHTALYSDVIRLWITSAGSLQAETGIQLIYDFSMHAAEVLDLSQEFAMSVLEAVTKTKADGKQLPSPPPKRPRSPSDEQECADIMEVYYIDKFHAMGPHGYNIMRATCMSSTACTPH